MALAGGILLAVGAIELLVGLFFYFRTRSFLERALDTTGTVKGFSQSSSSEGGTTYHPVVAYAAADGRTLEFTDSIGSNPPAFEVGETVPVKYDRARPESAKIAKPLRIWLVAGLLTSMGALSAAVGVLLLLLDA